MALEMKTQCERCQRSLSDDSEAYICSYECTYCSDCSEMMAFRCTNCKGELVRRPRRLPK